MEDTRFDKFWLILILEFTLLCHFGMWVLGLIVAGRMNLHPLMGFFLVEVTFAMVAMAVFAVMIHNSPLHDPSISQTVR